MTSLTDTAPALSDRLPGRVLLTGITGYVGGRLAPRLVDAGVEVVGLARRPENLSSTIAELVQTRQGDAKNSDDVAAAAVGCDVAYFLIHSLGGEDFEEKDRELAEAFRTGCERAGVGRIVYLGGLGAADDDLSPHLRSRQEVGRVLADGPIPVTELRAALVIGSGSASFEMLRWLTEVLPVMVVPRWVRETRCQPTAIDDVLQALVASSRRDVPGHDVLELGGADVMTYQEMMQLYASEAGLVRRRILPVPVLSPGLSARWVKLVTPLPAGLATDLVNSLANSVVVTGTSAAEVLGLDPIGMREAIGRSLARVEDLEIPTHWTDDFPVDMAALPSEDDPEWAGGTVLEDHRRVELHDVDPDDVWRVVSGIGGRTGWLAGSWMWELRGLLDKAFGGVGLRRGRRDPQHLRAGEVLDFWRVEDVQEGRCLRLRAEMRMPGLAWLQWSIVDEEGRPVIHQRARYVPRGLFGRAYWYALVPFHWYLFPRMLASIVERARTLDDDTSTEAGVDAGAEVETAAIS